MHIFLQISFANAFPNVLELRVDRENIGRIQEHRTFSWCQMDYVEGPMPMLYRLGLDSSIRELKVPSLTHNEPKHAPVSLAAPLLHRYFLGSCSSGKSIGIDIRGRPAVQAGRRHILSDLGHSSVSAKVFKYGCLILEQSCSQPCEYIKSFFPSSNR